MSLEEKPKKKTEKSYSIMNLCREKTCEENINVGTCRKLVFKRLVQFSTVRVTTIDSPALASNLIIGFATITDLPEPVAPITK